MYRKLAIPASASFIASVEYDVETSNMRVTFSNGTVVEAAGVPSSIATEIEQPGASVGSIWHAKLKKGFTWS